MSKLPDRSKQRKKFPWNDEDRAVALKHLEMVQRKRKANPNYPRHFCSIMSQLYETEKDPARKDAILEALHMGNYMAKELRDRGFRWWSGIRNITTRILVIARSHHIPP